MFWHQIELVAIEVLARAKGLENDTNQLLSIRIDLNDDEEMLGIVVIYLF